MKVKTSEVIFDILKIVMAFSVVGEAWYIKWREKHPRKIGETIEADAVILAVTYQRVLFQPREKQRAQIVVQYQNEAGKKVSAELPTRPVRWQLEQIAPELQKDMNVRIRYEKAHPHVFYFADPRYAAPEVSGEPRKIRGGWFGLILYTLLALFLLAITIWLWCIQ